MKKAYYEIPGPSSDDGAQKQFHLDWGSANHWAMPHQQPGPVQTVDKQDSVYCLTLPRQSKVSAPSSSFTGKLSHVSWAWWPKTDATLVPLPQNEAMETKRTWDDHLGNG